MIAAIVLIGAASMLACGWRRQWLDALLVLVAAAALAGVAADVRVPSLVSSGAAPAADTIAGDGLFSREWDDLPARAMRWTAPKTDALRLNFPAELALGRVFTLTVWRVDPGPARLQLLAENGQLLAEASGSGALAVQWLPPAAEKLVLQARLLDPAGKVIDQGPVPFVVRDAVPLHVQGRFDAPSFDVRALEQQLVASHAALDWQVTLGRAIVRSEEVDKNADKQVAADLAIVDAAWFEHATPAIRAALLARVAAGLPLVILAGNANDAGVWARTLQLPLTAQPDGKTTGGAMPLAVAPFNPAPAKGWNTADNIVWTRPWQQGRIAWLGAADWHKYAITQPQALAAWWQQVLDVAGVRREQPVTWLAPDDMALPDQRLAICAQGVKGESTFPQLGQTVAWQRRAEHVDAACVAVWPRQPGWLTMQPSGHAVYVYDPGDWPLWQRGQRRDATARYLARTPDRIGATAAPAASATPWCAIAFALAMLLLWWRERR